MHRVYHTIKTRRDDISSLRVDMGNPGSEVSKVISAFEE